jgi:hypothetical protein
MARSVDWGRLGFVELAASLFWSTTATRRPPPAGTAGIVLSRQVEAPVCLRRLVFVIRRPCKINIGCYLDGEPGLPIGGNHPRLTLWAAGDRHHEGPLTAHDQHECAGTEMGREDLRVGDHDRFREVPMSTLRRWTQLQQGVLISICAAGRNSYRRWELAMNWRHGQRGGCGAPGRA